MVVVGMLELGAAIVGLVLVARGIEDPTLLVGVGFAGLGALAAGGLHVAAGLLNRGGRGRALGIVALSVGVLGTAGTMLVPLGIALAVIGLPVYARRESAEAFATGAVKPGGEGEAPSPKPRLPSWLVAPTIVAVSLLACGPVAGYVTIGLVGVSGAAGFDGEAAGDEADALGWYDCFDLGLAQTRDCPERGFRRGSCLREAEAFTMRCMRGSTAQAGMFCTGIRSATEVEEICWENDIDDDGACDRLAQKVKGACARRELGRDDVEKDHASCLQLFDGTRRNECLAATAHRLGDPSVCADIGWDGGRDTCLRRVAKKPLDPGTCEEIALPHTRYDCLAAIATARNESETCELIEAPGAKAECATSVAAQTGNPKHCELIKVQHLRDSCLVHHKLRRTKDICSQVKTPYLRDRCHLQLKDGCEHVTNATMRKDCWLKVSHRDPAACEHLEPQPSPFGRHHCLQRAVIKNVPPWQCEKLGHATLVTACHQNVARWTSDVKVCEKIAEPILAVECRLGVAKELKDATLCGSLTGDAAAWCVSELSAHVKDPALCQLHLSRWERARCKKRVEP